MLGCGEEGRGDSRFLPGECVDPEGTAGILEEKKDDRTGEDAGSLLFVWIRFSGWVFFFVPSTGSFTQEGTCCFPGGEKQPF